MPLCNHPGTRPHVVVGDADLDFPTLRAFPAQLLGGDAVERLLVLFRELDLG